MRGGRRARKFGRGGVHPVLVRIVVKHRFLERVDQSVRQHRTQHQLIRAAQRCARLLILSLSEALLPFSPTAD